MQVIPQKFSARTSTVTVIYAEEGALRPRLRLSVFRLNYIQNYANSVLVIVPNQALIGIGGIRSDDSVSLKTTFGSLMVWDYDSYPWLKCKGQLFIRVFKNHLVRIKNCQRLDLSGLTSIVNYFLSNINILPVSFKQIFQILSLTNEALASRCT